MCYFNKVIFDSFTVLELILSLINDIFPLEYFSNYVLYKHTLICIICAYYVKQMNQQIMKLAIKDEIILAFKMLL